MRQRHRVSREYRTRPHASGMQFMVPGEILRTRPRARGGHQTRPRTRVVPTVLCGLLFI